MWTDLLVSRCVFYLFISTYTTGLMFNYPREEFWAYTLVHPMVYHGRTKRAISYTNNTAGTHHPELMLKLVINHKQYVLDLKLNEELVTDNYVFSYQNNGETVLNKPKREEIDLCQYHGRIRGKPGSRVAVSTCRGIHGVLFDDGETLYIEPAHGNTIDSSHFVYNHSDLKINKLLVPSRKTIVTGKNNNNTLKRLKRSHHYDKLEEPFNANSRSLYIEMVLVVDNTQYRHKGGDLRKVLAEMQDLANVINSIFVPLNIFVALVGVKVWNERDEIALSADAAATLDSFLKYRTEVLSLDMPNDNANLLTHQKFADGVVGKAYVSKMCDMNTSGTVVAHHSDVLGVMAASVAHEIGHTLGMDHDNEDCKCSEIACVMSPSAAHTTRWSQCSLQSLALFLVRGGDYCLRNKPSHLMNPSRCGNGFVERGEDCDCGSESRSRAECLRCCQPNCRLRTNATCAGGGCCDMKTCRLKPVATLCRSGSRECSLPEYCTGLSQFCPSDVHVMDTTPCDNNKAYCIGGRCHSHDSQCRLLWGPSAVNGHYLCYKNLKTSNIKTKYKYNQYTNSFIELSKEDAVCGLLQCEQYNDQLEFILNSGSNRKTISMNDKIISCHSANIETNANDENPSMVPNGAKCGTNKMCLNQRCVEVAAVRHEITKKKSVCSSDCTGHGICNSKGNCHCDEGFAPPFCDQPGAGGSVDSGPASDVKVLRDFMIAMYIIFLGILPLILLIIFVIYYIISNNKQRWGKWSNSRYSRVLKIPKLDTKPKKCVNDKEVISKLRKEDIKIITVPANVKKSETYNNRDLITISNDSLNDITNCGDKLSSSTVRPKTPTFSKDLRSVKTIKNSLILNSKKGVKKNNNAIRCNEITIVHHENINSKAIHETVRKDLRKPDSNEKSVIDKTAQCNTNVKHLRTVFDQPNNLS